MNTNWRKAARKRVLARQKKEAVQVGTPKKQTKREREIEDARNNGYFEGQRHEQARQANLHAESITRLKQARYEARTNIL